MANQPELLCFVEVINTLRIWSSMPNFIFLVEIIRTIINVTDLFNVKSGQYLWWLVCLKNTWCDSTWCTRWCAAMLQALYRCLTRNNACLRNGWALLLWFCIPNPLSIDMWIQAQLPESVFMTHLTWPQASEFRFNCNPVFKCRGEVLRDRLLMYLPSSMRGNVSLPWRWYHIQTFPTGNPYQNVSEIVTDRLLTAEEQMWKNESVLLILRSATAVIGALYDKPQ